MPRIAKAKTENETTSERPLSGITRESVISANMTASLKTVRDVAELFLTDCSLPSIAEIGKLQAKTRREIVARLIKKGITGELLAEIFELQPQDVYMFIMRMCGREYIELLEQNLQSSIRMVKLMMVPSLYKKLMEICKEGTDKAIIDTAKMLMGELKPTEYDGRSGGERLPSKEMLERYNGNLSELLGRSISRTA